MKNLINLNLKKLLFLPLIILMTFSSCQDEVVDITDPNEQETLVANSTLANLMENTALRDGSYDNIIDNANCLSINLPVTIIVNGIEITIDSEEDFAVIEAIFDEFNDDDDILEIVFPITIILNDFTEVTINNLEELEQFIDECSGENEDDDDIECIDFQYPISISVYDSNFQVIDTVEINDDEELYDFIEDLDGGLLASINFPVTLIKADGTTIVVNNNDELQEAIEAAENACDEDDDNDYDDDDNNDIPTDDLTYLLTHCSWTVDKLEIDDQDLEEQYVGYVFTFNVNGTVRAEINGNFDEGTWELIETDSGLKLNLQMENLTDFNNQMWLLHEIEDDGVFKIDFRQGEDRLRFQKEGCDVNSGECSEVDVDTYLAECHWVGDVNGTADFNNYDFYFLGDQVLKALNPLENTETFGTWTTSENSDGDVIITVEMPAPLQDFNGEWTVIECAEGRIKIVNANDVYIVFERECENDPTCSEQEVNTFLMECEWFAVNYNGNDNLMIYELDFNDQQEFTITNTTNNEIINATWVSTQGNDNVVLTFSSVNGPDIQAINGEWLVSECAEDRFKLIRGDDFMIIERECN